MTPTQDTEMSNYAKYRGKCKEMCDVAIKDNPSLTLVRGYYWEPLWNTIEPHWWTVDENGKIFDPTRLQFPSQGFSEYIPFDGMVECAQCGKEIKEEEADIEGNYCFCSYTCHGRFVGVL